MMIYTLQALDQEECMGFQKFINVKVFGRFGLDVSAEQNIM